MGEEIALKVLEDGLTWRTDSETLVNGNCFYNAVVQQTHRPEIKARLSPEKQNLTPNQLRRQVVNYVKSIFNKFKINPSAVSDQADIAYISEYEKWSFPLLKEDYKLPPDMSFPDYLDLQGTDASKPLPAGHKSDWYWATDLFEQATAAYLQITILQNTNSCHPQRPVQTFHPNFDEKGSDNPIFMALGCKTNVHFQSFLPQPNTNSQSTCKVIQICRSTFWKVTLIIGVLLP